MFSSLGCFFIQRWSRFQNIISGNVHLSPATRILNENPANDINLLSYNGKGHMHTLDIQTAPEFLLK